MQQNESSRVKGLTDIELKKLKPTEKMYRRSDSSGLYIQVEPNGGMYWRLKYRFEGKERTLSIGTYPTITLKMARLERDKAKLLIAQGVDPNVAKKQHIRSISILPTFAELAIEWLQSRIVKPNTMKRDKAIIENDFLKYIGDMPIDTLDAKKILECAKRIEKRNAIETARRSIPLVGNVFKMAIRKELIDKNPTDNLLDSMEAKRKVKHMPRIPINELPKLLNSIDNYDGSFLTKAALNLICLTFVRTSELRFMEWSELDIKEQLWRIPAERMKMGMAHIVPLSTQAISIIESLRPLTGHQKFVFYNHSSYKPISENAILGALWRMGYKGRMTGHGFRGLASTTLHEQGYLPDAIEIQLAHSVGSAVSSAYNFAQYLDRRKVMMQDWADFIDMVKLDAKVFPFSNELAS